MLHLKDEVQDGVSFITLWGGPVNTQTDNIHPEDDAAVKEWCRVLINWGERNGDDGKCWYKKLLILGLDICEVQLDEDQRPHVRLYDGSWLVFDCDGTDLADEAFVRGILNLEDRLLPAGTTWKGLGVRAIAIENTLPE